MRQVLLKIFSTLVFTSAVAVFSVPVWADYETGVKAVMMGDYPTAMKNFRAAAERGDAKAQFELGLMYEQGDGVDRNFAEAARWYRKAMAQGHELAEKALQRVEPRATVNKRKKEDTERTVDLGPRSGAVKTSRGIPTQPVSPSAGYVEELEKLHKRPMSDNANIVPALKANIRTLTPPYLYELARRTFDADRRESSIWFITGYLRAAYDALKCTDRSARQGVRQLPNLAPRVAKILAADRAYAKEMMLEALEREKSFPELSDPSWICFHGMKAMIAAMEHRQFTNWAKPQEQWGEIRREFMARVRNSLR